MYTVRKITAEYFDSFPEELICEIVEHLTDLQQEAARIIARENKKAYLLDIEIICTEKYPMGQMTPMVYSVLSFALNKLVYFRALYMESDIFRDRIRNIVGEELMNIDESIMTRRRMCRLEVEAMSIWNYVCGHYPAVFEAITETYIRAKQIRSRWKHVGCVN